MSAKPCSKCREGPRVDSSSWCRKCLTAQARIRHAQLKARQAALAGPHAERIRDLCAAGWELSFRAGRLWLSPPAPEMEHKLTKADQP
jgi:hypothetical protein